jgi:hypothetical protein
LGNKEFIYCVYYFLERVAQIYRIYCLLGVHSVPRLLYLFVLFLDMTQYSHADQERIYNEANKNRTVNRQGLGFAPAVPIVDQTQSFKII